MGPAAGAVIEIISDDEKEDPLSAKPTADALAWASSLLLDDLTGLGEGLDDDCMILDGDPDKPLVVVKPTADEKEDPLSAKPTADALAWASSLLLDDLTGLGEGLDDDCVILDGDPDKPLVVVKPTANEKEDPLSAKPTADALAWASSLLLNDLTGLSEGLDDDCVILDGDLDKPLVVVKEEKPGKDEAEEELQVVSEKGEVACRDFPHPRHLCARLPFGTGSHANHCTMCHCYVCDSRAPCPRWGKGTLATDHCHATDKDENWKKQRQSHKRKSAPPTKREGVKKMSFSSSSATTRSTACQHSTSASQPATCSTKDSAHEPLQWPSPAGQQIWRQCRFYAENSSLVHTEFPKQSYLK